MVPFRSGCDVSFSLHIFLCFATGQGGFGCQPERRPVTLCHLNPNPEILNHVISGGAAAGYAHSGRRWAPVFASGDTGGPGGGSSGDVQAETPVVLVALGV
ncbi:hypothetical protein V8F20_007422 [Naviculisporaceae sp. PSN 640]